MNYEDFPSLSSPTIETSVISGPAVKPTFVRLEAADLNLEDELLVQYNRARELLHDAKYLEDVPLNQKAQVINSATSILGALIKNKAELYSLERIKKIENILLDTLKSYPDMQETFLAQYSAAFPAE